MARIFYGYNRGSFGVCQGMICYEVYNIDFDFDDGIEEPITREEKKSIIADNLGKWYALDDDDLIEDITSTSGWCIKHIDYEIAEIV